MTYIWNIYEPLEPGLLGPDPYDVFVYALRRDEEPRKNDLLYVEGRRCRVAAVTEDFGRNEYLAGEDERYYKVCIV